MLHKFHTFESLADNRQLTIISRTIEEELNQQGIETTSYDEFSNCLILTNGLQLQFVKTDSTDWLKHLMTDLNNKIKYTVWLPAIGQLPCRKLLPSCNLQQAITAIKQYELENKTFETFVPKKLDRTLIKDLFTFKTELQKLLPYKLTEEELETIKDFNTAQDVMFDNADDVDVDDWDDESEVEAAETVQANEINAIIYKAISNSNKKL